MTTIPTNSHTDDAAGIPATNPAFSDAVNAALEGAVITDGYIDNAATTVAALDGQIETLQSEKSTLETQVTTLDGQVSDLVADVATLSDEVSTLQSEKSTLEGQVTALEGDVTTLTDQVSTLQSDKTTLEGQVTTLEGQVTALEGDVTALTDQVSTLQSDKTTLEGQVTTLEGQVTTLEGQVTALEDDVTTLTDQVSTLQSEKTALEEELAAAGDTSELEAIIAALTEHCAISTVQVATNVGDALPRGVLHGHSLFLPHPDGLVTVVLNYRATPGRLVLETGWSEDYMSSHMDQTPINIGGISCNISQGENGSGDIYANGLSNSSAAALVADRINSVSGGALYASASGATLTVVTATAGNSAGMISYSADNVTQISSSSGEDGVTGTPTDWIVVDVASGDGSDVWGVTGATMLARLLEAIQADDRYNAIAVDGVTMRIYNTLPGYVSNTIGAGDTGFTVSQEESGS
jgi:hypothetical protein